jgi:hypothetical protein
MDTHSLEYDIAVARVRYLNDEARRHLTDGTVVFTRGITALPVDDQAAILDLVCNYDDFTFENDPFEEHCFGMFSYKGHDIEWAIDCYELGDEAVGSPDPSDPTVTRRVLTIMLAGER